MKAISAAVALRHSLRSFTKSSSLLFLIFASIAFTAIEVSAQTQKARPVARLISSLRTETPEPTRSRPRLVSSNQSTASTVYAVAPISLAATSDERRAFELVNAERAEYGQEPLQWDGALCRMARQQSESMARMDYFSHTGPDGVDMAARARALDLRGWRALGENIAYNQGFEDPVAFAVERWMVSSHHRANILSSQFTRTGLGIARASDGRVFFTQVFMR
jgi:uncharacterized protein YkwD